MTPKSKGIIEREGDLLSLSFGFHKQRFEIIKRLEGVYYHKDSKSWKVPLRHLQSIEKSRYFTATGFDYLFDIDQAHRDIQEIKENREKSRAEIRQNPFFVPEELIARANVDLAVRKSAHYSSLEISVRSRAKVLLNAVEGIFQYGDSDSHFFPTMQLRQLLSYAKSHRFLFAVEKTTGELLQSTSALRAKVQAGYAASCAELEQSLLVPFVCPIEDPAHRNEVYFEIKQATAQHLKYFFPGIRSAEERRQKSLKLSRKELLIILANMLLSPITLWLSSEALLLFKSEQELALRKLTENPRNFNSQILPIIQPQMFWHRSYSSQAGLYANASVLPQLQTEGFNIPPEVSGQTPLHFSHYHFFSGPESVILDFYRHTERLLGNKFSIHQTGEFSLLIDDLLNREKLLQQQAYYHSITDCAADCLDTDLESRLFPHQRIAVRWLKDSKIALLGDDMGLGKTLSVLTSFADLKTRGILDFALIVCPNSLTANWLRESHHWLPQLNLSTISRQKKERENFLETLKTGSPLFLDGLVINYEALRLDYVYPIIAEYLKMRRSLVVLDESQRAKNSQSKTFQALSDLCASAERRFLLTGTPTPKELSDIWSQVYLLDRGVRFGDNYYKWLEQVADIGNKWSDYAVNKYKPLESREAVRRVHEILLRRKKEDVVSLPEKIFSIRDVELSGEQLKRYEQVRKELLMTVSSHQGEEFVREIQSILEEYLRAVQVASNPRLVDPTWQGTPAKFEELDEIVEEIVKENDRNLVIWTNYILNVGELVERFKAYGAAPFSGEVKPEVRAQTVADFQSRNLKILVAIPAAGGVGITLTAAQTAVYLDKTWNGEHWMQSIDRLHRIGQKGTVHIISLHASKIDSLISKNLEKKRIQQEQLLTRSGIVSNSEIPSREELLGALS